MLSRSERILENIPVGSLGIIPLLGCEELGNKVNDYRCFTPWPACTGSTRWRGWPSASLSATWSPPATKLPCEANLPPPAAPTARAFCGLPCRGAACPAAWPLVRAALRPASCICCITAAWGPGPWWSAPWSSLPA